MSFLVRFDKFNFDTSWQVLRVGRIGRLVLEGIYGLLHIYVVYLDPSDSRHQCSDIDLLGSSLDSRAHSLVVGDLNFVQEASDRYLKATGTYSLGDDAAVAKQWTSSIASRGLVELKQPYHTCETGICFSRIDRIYSSLHAASIFLLDTSCVALDQEPELSDHRPVSCFFRRRVRSQSTSVPSWVVDHPAFGEEVFAEYHYRIRSAPGDGFSRLAVFKDSVRCACKYIKHVKHSQPAQTVQDKLSACVAFVRALHDHDLRAARKYQSIYPYLRSVDIDEEPLSSIAFTELKNHIIELGHTSVKDRVEELKTVKRQLPDSVYQQRKQNILSLLRKMLLGQSSGIVAIRDPDTGEVVREPRDIAF